MRDSITCAWCGGHFVMTPRRTPKLHKHGKTTCEGSYEEKDVHQRLLKEKARTSSKETQPAACGA